VGDMLSAWLNVALGQESASLTPLAAVGRAAVLEAGSATRYSAVDHANRENFSYILLPVCDTLAVFVAGSGTLDTSDTPVATVDHATRESAASTPLSVLDLVAVFEAGSATHDTAANYDDADFGDYASEGDDEQPSTASTVLPEGSKDGKLNLTQFAPMTRRRLDDNVIDRDARVPPPSTAAASTDQVTPPSTQRQFAKLGKRKVPSRIREMI
jgi:hypothetical protein